MRSLVAFAVALGAASSLGVAAATTATRDSTPARPPSHVVRAGADFQRVGDFWVRRDPTYRGALAAFGRASACRLVARSTRVADAVWRTLGVRVRLATLGALGAGETACSDPARVWINVITVSGRDWRTSRGLRIGDSRARVLRLYPRASYHRRGGLGPARSWWLVTGRDPCIGSRCGARRRVSVPRLAARMRAGRVASFVLPVRAQGD
ncbi:MAG: hypothetical protein M3M94_02845 [Actinomycetota bacterium]|nr:hypothetical protein [Actinomycetota bacterium]